MVVHLGLNVCLCIHNTQFSIIHNILFSIIHKAVNFYAFFIRSLDRGRWQYSRALHRDPLQKTNCYHYERKITEIYALLRYYALYSANSLPTFRSNLPLLSSRVKNPRRNHAWKIVDFSILLRGTDSLASIIRQIFLHLQIEKVPLILRMLNLKLVKKFFLRI